MKLIFLLLTPILLFSKVHYAKVEPYESFNVKSSVSALVIDTNLSIEGRIFSGTVISLDDKLDLLSLGLSKNSIKNIKDMLKINETILSFQEEVFQNNQVYFEKLDKLSTVSKTQKDDAFTKYTTSKVQYLSTKEKVLNLNQQLIDLNYKVSQLEDSIDKKDIKVDNKFISEILVTPGDFVNPGTPLMNVVDLTKAKLVIYLDVDELNSSKKLVYIDDMKTNYKLNKVWSIADKKFISSYKAEIYIDSSYGFSQLVKVELK